MSHGVQPSGPQRRARRGLCPSASRRNEPRKAADVSPCNLTAGSCLRNRKRVSGHHVGAPLSQQPQAGRTPSPGPAGTRTVSPPTSSLPRAGSLILLEWIPG